MRISRQLILIILAYFAIRLPWLFSVPMVEAPDEFSHYWVFRFIAEHMHLPSAAEVALGGPSGVYGSLPQMGYIPHVLVCKILPIGDLSLVGRFGSLIAGLFAVVAAYFIGLEIFSASLCALALPVMMLFQPQLVFLNSYSNSDTTTCALTTVLLYVFIRILKTGITVKKALLVGFLLGWTVLTKYSGVAVFPAALVALGFSFYIHKVSIAKSIQYLVIVGATFLTTCGWWFIHSMQEFHGDLLGTKTMRETWARTYNRPLAFHMSPWKVLKDQLFWSTVHDSFWGLFGYMTRFLPPSIYYTYLGFLWAAIISGARVAFLKLAKLNSTTAETLTELQLPSTDVQPALVEVQSTPSDVSIGQALERRTALVLPAIWLTLAACCFTNFAALTIGASMNLGGAQGRYLFPSEAALVALLIAGLARLGKFGIFAVAALVIFNAFVCVYAFVMLMHTPGYGFTTKLY
jgi:4-amino-4-deoxy-L-arabinose transferase-like glycosyltransferase